MISVFSCPSRYTQGPDATERLGSEIASLGLRGPVLVLAAPSAARLLADRWKATFDGAGFEHSVLTFGGECSVREIERVEKAARAAGARVVAPGESIHNEPFEVTQSMVSRAILEADALGRSWIESGSAGRELREGAREAVPGTLG